MEHPEEPAQTARPGHETKDASARFLVKLGFWLVVLVVVVLGAMGALYDVVIDRAERADVPPSPLADTREPFAGPRLFLTPSEELQELKAAEEEILTSYGWVDAEGGWVRIPIERAMDLLVERGLPSSPPDSGQSEEGEGSGPGR